MEKVVNKLRDSRKGQVFESLNARLRRSADTWEIVGIFGVMLCYY